MSKNNFFIIRNIHFMYMQCLLEGLRLQNYEIIPITLPKPIKKLPFHAQICLFVHIWVNISAKVIEIPNKYCTFAFRIRSFLDKEPEVFRILLKHHIRIARMTKATKLTPHRRGH